jgi:uracil phosphoribosyltransferase
VSLAPTKLLQEATDCATFDPMTPKVHIISHPLVQHKLTLMRMRETPSAEFRRLLHEISMLMAYEVTRDLPLTTLDIETPVAPMKAPYLDGRNIALVSVLRAGNGILGGFMDIMPTARVGHIGLYRDHETLAPVEYYFKMPPDMSERDVIIVDPMVATGNSASAAVSRIKSLSPRSIKFVSIVASPEGIELFHNEHPDVVVFTAAVDERLNEHGYIVPGLGDAGDRIYGTK